MSRTSPTPFVIRCWTFAAHAVRSLPLAALIAGLIAIPALAQSGGGYAIKKSTIDGGGVTFHTGGAYRLAGTVGQHDAGALAGGGYNLTGGFWSPASTCVAASAPAGAGAACTLNAQCNPPGGVEGVCANGRCHTPYNRYLTFLAPALPSGATTLALRVTFAKMPGAADCPAIPDYSAFQGDVMWVGAPDATTGVSRLVNAPVYRDWGSAPVKVSDCNIVPCATYTVEAISDVCLVSQPASFSSPIAIKTASRWGDVAGTVAGVLSAPDGGAPSFLDIGWIVDRFKGAPTVGPSEKPRVDICKNVPTQGGGSANVDFFDIGCDVDAFQGKTYDQSVKNGSGQHGPAGSSGTCALP